MDKGKGADHISWRLALVAEQSHVLLNVQHRFWSYSAQTMTIRDSEAGGARQGPNLQRRGKGINPLRWSYSFERNRELEFTSYEQKKLKLTKLNIRTLAENL
jgi:hypothetical protein